MLDERLSVIAELVPPSDVAADIGTDHALLPCELISQKKCKAVIAVDIRPGPVLRARKQVKKAGYEKKIKVILGDGMKPVVKYKPSVYIIAGMGGELIASVIEECRGDIPAGTKFVLQPMTRAPKLRIYLAENGFKITDERVTSKKNGRLFEIIAAEYDGVKRDIGPVEALIGEKNIERGGDLEIALIRRELYRMLKVKTGLAKSGEKISENETKIIEKLAAMATEKTDDLKEIKE